MDAPPLFSALIVSRPNPRAAVLRRGAGVAAACLVHLAGISFLVLAPILFLEMVEPPKAVVGPPIILWQPYPPIDHPGGHSRLPSLRDGGRRAKGGSAPGGAKQTPLKPPTPTVQPDRIPLAPPETQATAQSVSALLTSHLETTSQDLGDGREGGPGDGPPGSPNGCPGCKGDGSGEGPGGGDEVFGPGDPRVMQPVLIESTRAVPKYPETARRARIEGTVILLITIGPDGTVGEVEVLRAPDQIWGFDLAALEAVKRWRYRPALMSGRPVSVYAQVMVEFTLSR